jgi:hypothetical protein
MWPFTARVNEKTAPIERVAAVQFAAAYRRVVRPANSTDLLQMEIRPAPFGGGRLSILTCCSVAR